MNLCVQFIYDKQSSCTHSFQNYRQNIKNFSNAAGFFFHPKFIVCAIMFRINFSNFSITIIFHPDICNINPHTADHIQKLLFILLHHSCENIPVLFRPVKPQHLHIHKKANGIIHSFKIFKHRYIRNQRKICIQFINIHIPQIFAKINPFIIPFKYHSDFFHACILRIKIFLNYALILKCYLITIFFIFCNKQNTKNNRIISASSIPFIVHFAASFTADLFAQFLNRIRSKLLIFIFHKHFHISNICNHFLTLTFICQNK